MQGKLFKSTKSCRMFAVLRQVQSRCRIRGILDKSEELAYVAAEEDPLCCASKRVQISDLIGYLYWDKFIVFTPSLPYIYCL
jgi:hypothetical protein